MSFNLKIEKCFSLEIPKDCNCGFTSSLRQSKFAQSQKAAVLSSPPSLAALPWPGHYAVKQHHAITQPFSSLNKATLHLASSQITAANSVTICTEVLGSI